MMYNMYTNDLCFDIYTEIDPVTISLDMEAAFIECEKTLVDCIDDFGQNSKYDRDYTTKPLGPFAKFLDKCELGHDENYALKIWKPFDTIQYYETNGGD